VFVDVEPATEYDGMTVYLSLMEDTMAIEFSDIGFTCDKTFHLYDSKGLESQDFDFLSNTLTLVLEGNYTYKFELDRNGLYSGAY
jgi:hypothetical protein